MFLKFLQQQSNKHVPKRIIMHFNHKTISNDLQIYLSKGLESSKNENSCFIDVRKVPKQLCFYLKME